MKKLNPAKFIFGFLGLSTFASLVGTISGTLAWYAYSARAAVSYSGTSVSSALQLKIGLASINRIPVENNALSNSFWEVMHEVKVDESDPNSEPYKYIHPETNQEYYCYFADVGVGLDPQILQYHAKINGYAADAMMPITSGFYDLEEDPNCEFNLYKSPSALHHKQDIESEHENYMKLPFIFQALKTNVSANATAEEKYSEPGNEIWLVDAVSHPNSIKDGEVYKAIRVFVDRFDSIGDDFIISPMSPTSGKTNVGGILDLTNDQYYDYDFRSDIQDYGEVLYGDYVIDSGLTDTGYDGPDDFQDIYRIFDPSYHVTTNDQSCFVSKHREGIRYYDTLEHCTFKKAAYLCMDDVRPDRHPVTGAMKNFNDEKPTHVCVTGDAEHNYIGFTDLTLWLEGWDFHAIDDFQMHKFDFGLTFEINKI